MEATLNRNAQSFGDGYDGIVIRHAFEDKVGGATLDATDMQEITFVEVI